MASTIFILCCVHTDENKELKYGNKKKNHKGSNSNKEVEYNVDKKNDDDRSVDGNVMFEDRNLNTEAEDNIKEKNNNVRNVDGNVYTAYKAKFFLSCLSLF